MNTLMFWSKKRQQEYLRMKGDILALSKHVCAAVSAAVSADSITSCENCGCLLTKSKRWKQPSTIFERHSSFMWRTEECIVTHYMCGRCAPKKGGRKQNEDRTRE